MNNDDIKKKLIKSLIKNLDNYQFQVNIILIINNN